MSAIACYAMSLAPITWVVISEIFPNRIRGAAMSVAVLSLWIGCTALTFTFPLLNRSLGAHGVLAVRCDLRRRLRRHLQTLPETKGKIAGRDRTSTRGLVSRFTNCERNETDWPLNLARHHVASNSKPVASRGRLAALFPGVAQVRT